MRGRSAIVVVALLASLLAVVATTAGVAAADPSVETLAPANTVSAPDVSDDGNVIVYLDEAAIMVYDRVAGTATALETAGGQPLLSFGGEPRVSGDGRFVVANAHVSPSGPPPTGWGLTLVDRDTGSIENVAIAPSGAPILSIGPPSISDDGSRIAFVTYDPVGGGDTAYGDTDIVLRDRLGASSSFAPIDPALNAWVTDPDISGDGQWLTFTSSYDFDSSEAPADSDDDVWVVDLDPLTASLPQRVSSDDGLDLGLAVPSSRSSLSESGRFVVFESAGSAGLDEPSVWNLVDPDSSADPLAVYLWDRDTDGDGDFTGPGESLSTSMTRVSVGRREAKMAEVNGDGTTVSFLSRDHHDTWLVDGLVEVWKRDTASGRFVFHSFTARHDAIHTCTRLAAPPARHDFWGYGCGHARTPAVLADSSDRLVFTTVTGLSGSETEMLRTRRLDDSPTYLRSYYWFLIDSGAYPSVADPVQTATGALTLSATDISAPANTFGLDWTRHYYSLSPAVGLLGPGWTDSYSIAVIEDVGSGEAELLDERGRLVTFTPDGVGGWHRPDEFYGDLVRRPDDSLAVEFVDRTMWEFGLDGRVEELVNWDGQSVTITRDPAGRPVDAVNTSTGEGIHFEYPVAGAALKSATASWGPSVTYRLGSSLEVERGGDGFWTRYEIDDSGLVLAEYAEVSLQSPGRLLAEQTYDDFGRVAVQTTPTGLAAPDDAVVTTFAYSEDGRTTTVHDSVTDSSLTYTHDAMGRLATVEDPFGQTYVPAYGTDGRLESATTRSGNTLGATYDPTTALIESMTDGSAGTTNYTYDAFDRPATVTAPNGTPSGATTTYCYDVTAYPANCYGNSDQRIPARVTDDLGHHTDYVVVDGLVQSVTDPDGVSTSYAYDSRRRVVSVTDGEGNVSTTDYCEDAFGLTVQATAPRGALTPDGPPCVSPDPDDHVTESRFDHQGRLLWQIAPDGGETAYVYDGSGRLATVIDPTGAETTYTYDPATGERASETRPGPTGSGAATVTTTWATEHRMIGGQPREVRVTIGPDGARTEEVYGPLNRLESSRVQYDGAATASDPSDDLFRTTSYTYAADGQVATVANNAGEVSVSRHDAAGRVTEVCDPEGRRTVTDYDAAGRVSAVHGPWDDDPASTACATGPPPTASPTVTYEYDDLNRTTATIAPDGARSEVAFTPGGRIDTETDAVGLVTRRSYDSAGRVEWTELPGGVGQRRTTFSYDPDGNMTGVTDPEGGVTTTTFDEAGRVLTVTDPAGVVTTSSWSARGELVSRQLEGQGVEEFSYDAAGLLEWVEDALDHRSTYVYDVAGRQKVRTDPLGGSVQWAWFDDGQLRSQTDPLNRSTVYGYDLAGRVATVADPSGRVTTSTYTPAGLPATVAYAGGDTTTYGYDPAGRVATATNSRGTWAWTYHLDGTVATQSTPAGRVTSWAYDEANRPTTVGYPDGFTLDQGYDALTGRLATLSPGEVMADTFTAPNATVPDAAQWTTTVTTGSTALVSGNRLALSHTSAANSAATLTSKVANAGDVDVSLRYQFGDVTNPSRLRVYLRETTGTTGTAYRVDVPNNSATGTIYRVVGATATSLGTFAVPNSTGGRRFRAQVQGTAVRVRVWADGDSEPAVWTATVNDTNVTAAGGTRATWIRTSGGASTVTVDDWSQTNPTSAPAPLVVYGYDDADRVTSETLPAGARTWTYSNGQLTGYNQTVPGAVRATTLTYDSSGRQRTTTTGTATSMYSYDLAGQLKTVAPSTGATLGFTYDLAGRRATSTSGTNVTTYAHDPAGQLGTIDPPGTTANTTYTYDGAGRRLTATTGTAVTTYAYDPAGRLATLTGPGTTGSHTRTYDPTGALDSLTTTIGTVVTPYKLDWAGTRLLNWATPTATTNLIGHQPGWAAINTGLTNAALATDILGSVIPSTGITGLARANTYDTFGKPTGTDTHQPRLAYRGELQTANLIHLRNRDYDPTTTTFTTTDPLPGINGTPTLTNPYHYTNNNPLNLVDPLGLRPSDGDFVECREDQELLESTPGSPGLHIEAFGPTCLDNPTDDACPAGTHRVSLIIGSGCRPDDAGAGPDVADRLARTRFVPNSGGALRTCATTGSGAEVFCVENSRFLPALGDPVAVTYGHYVFCVGPCGPVLAHELVHVAQWERYGDRFAVLYLLASRGRSDCTNPYEREAYTAPGGGGCP